MNLPIREQLLNGVGAGGEREQEGLSGEAALGGEFQHELGEHDAAGVVGEERTGERGDDADAAQQVAAALAPPGACPGPSTFRRP